MKTKAQALVKNEFKLGTMSATKTARLIAKLLKKGAFTFADWKQVSHLAHHVVVESDSFHKQRKGVYGSSLIVALITDQWFGRKKSCEARGPYGAAFNPIPIATIALAATAVRL